VIIGFRSKKILFIGIRNRYCVVCERAKTLRTSVKPHTCFLNCTEGATSIESSTIAEGFSNSIEMHGLKFNKLIGKNQT